MDSRTAAQTLRLVSQYLALAGGAPFRARAYETAARAVLALEADDLAPLLRSGALATVSGIGPATLSVLRDLIETGESRYLEQLRAETPEGLLAMLRVPGLAAAKIHVIHEQLGVASLEELEAAARDGRLATLKGFGPKTAQKLLRSIALVHETGTLVLAHRALAEAERLVAMVRSHPEVVRAEAAGAVRRRREVVGEIDVVAACADGADAVGVAASFTRAPGVRETTGAGTRHVGITYVDGTRLELRCVPAARFAAALWRATGSAAHAAEVEARLAARGLALDGEVLRDGAGREAPVADEAALYAAAGLAYVPPELREHLGEVEAAASGALPTLLELDDLQGVLHCHSEYSDGRGTIAELARAARARGWRYLGISDHSQAAFYAGGLSRAQVIAQHEEIDAVNARLAAEDADFRVLKGIEADILADGRLDYDAEVLDRFDYVIGSIHSRFAMEGPAMTARVLRALDEPHLTVLAHPTGRLLLSREPYDLDLDAVLEKAAAVGVAVELNADPHRLDLDWRHLVDAKARGVTIAIGPDAHSPQGLDNVRLGIGIARKGWLERRDVLNARSADEVLAFARRRRG